MKTNLEDKIEEAKKNTIKLKEVKKQKEKQLVQFQKTGKSEIQNQITALNREIIYTNKKNGKLKKTL